MKEKFYLVTEEIFEACSNFSPKPKLFRNEKKAYDYFNERKKEALADIEKNNWVVEESADQIEVFNEGYFAHDRHCVYITEVEVVD